MQSARGWIILAAGILLASCARERGATQAPTETIRWSDCKQVMDSERIVAHTCDGYSWVRFSRPPGAHAAVIAEASQRGRDDHGWSSQTTPLPRWTVPASESVSAIVFRSREAAQEVIKVSVIASRADARFSSGYAVTVCSREFDAYRERLPDPRSAVARVSSVCGQGSTRLRGL